MNDHIVLEIGSGTFKCLACEAEYTPKYPIPLTMLEAMIQAFQKTHEVCDALGENDETTPNP